MKRFRFVGACLLLVGSIACDDASQPTAPATDDAAPDAARSLVGGRMAVDGPNRDDFIVLLGDHEDPDAVAEQHGLNRRFTFRHVFKGFSATLPEAARAALLKDGRVRQIVPDQVVTVDVSLTTDPLATTAESWGLDRVDQRSASLDGVYHHVATGRGVTAYVVDTGIRFTHRDFGGRATFGFDAFGEDGVDCHGHGTHVAGTVGGTTYGVAKDVAMVAVRVLGCGGAGSTGGVVAGLDWIVANAVRPAVVNMSLGGGINDVLDAAVESVIAAGIPVAVAAGNNTADACNASPARVPGAMTTGATDADDVRAGWSNWGMCVDWFAPGISITSDGYAADDATAVMSGTSMASPHTAGAAALYLEGNPSAGPAEVAQALAATSTKGAVSGSYSPASDLLYTLDDGTDGSGGHLPPVSEFSFACTDLTCQFTDQSSDPDGRLVGWQWIFGDHTGGLGPNPSHTFPAEGTYAVSLIVRDDQGLTTPVTHDVLVGSVQEPPPENQPPVASFRDVCSGLSCDFQDLSTDADGSITEWRWAFGDGSSETRTSGTGVHHEFAAGGTYHVTLTVADDGGATSGTSRDVVVQAAGITLSAVASKAKGKHVIDLSWQGATTPEVDIQVTGYPAVRTGNTGRYSFMTDGRGKSTYGVRVCEVGTGVCSTEQQVSF